MDALNCDNEDAKPTALPPSTDKVTRCRLEEKGENVSNDVGHHVGTLGDKASIDRKPDSKLCVGEDSNNNGSHSDITRDLKMNLALKGGMDNNDGSNSEITRDLKMNLAMKGDRNNIDGYSDITRDLKINCAMKSNVDNEGSNSELARDIKMNLAMRNDATNRDEENGEATLHESMPGSIRNNRRDDDDQDGWTIADDEDRLGAVAAGPGGTHTRLLKGRLSMQPPTNSTTAAGRRNGSDHEQQQQQHDSNNDDIDGYNVTDNTTISSNIHNDTVSSMTEFDNSTIQTAEVSRVGSVFSRGVGSAYGTTTTLTTTTTSSTNNVGSANRSAPFFDDSPLQVQEQHQQPSRQRIHSSEYNKKLFRARIVCVSLWVVLIVLVVTVVTVVVVVVSGDGGDEENTSKVVDEKNDTVPVIKSLLQTKIEWLTSDPVVFEDSDSPQRMALDWLLNEDQIGLDYETSSDDLKRIEARFALAVFYYASTKKESGGANGEFPFSLSPTLHECNWTTSENSAPLVADTNAGGIEDEAPQLPQSRAIICDSFLQVIELVIEGWNIEGTIPFELQALAELEVLQLRDNAFTGEIPHTLTRLTKLTLLDLGGNELTSTLPSELGTKLGQLTALRLGRGNNLVGAIPQTYASLEKLEELDLSLNALTGDILGGGESSVWNLRRLRLLDVLGCDLTGTVSSDLSQATNLHTLRIGGNKGIYGFVPTEIGALGALHEFSAAGNSLSGSFPWEYMMTTSQRNLTKVDLDHNSFSGTLPATNFGGEYSSSLQELHVSFNLHQSSIPESLADSFPNLKYLDLSDNRLTGPLPASIGNMSGLEVLNVSYNSDLYGTLPSALGNLHNLTELLLHGNKFSGEVPVEFSSLSSLSKFITFSPVHRSFSLVHKASGGGLWCARLAQCHCPI